MPLCRVTENLYIALNNARHQCITATECISGATQWPSVALLSYISLPFSVEGLNCTRSLTSGRVVLVIIVLRQTDPSKVLRTTPLYRATVD